MPAQSPATARPGAEATRTHLLDAAERRFERQGIPGTTMTDIAAEAGVSRPTLYRYFADRDVLITSIAQRRAAKFAGKMRSVLAKQVTLEEQLIEGMLYLGRVGQRDQFFSSLITPGTLGEAHQVLMAPKAALDFAAEVWGPVLDAAEERGELRPGLDRDLAYGWLTSINIVLIGWVENAGGATGAHRELLREYFAPAFLRD